MSGSESKCLGRPGSYLGCGAHAGIVLVQLRPGPDGHPALYAVGVCPDHVDDVRDFMASTWPADDIRMMSLAVFLEEMQPLHEQAGTRVVVTA